MKLTDVKWREKGRRGGEREIWGGGGGGGREKM